MAVFTGTSGDDSILGTGAGDEFHLEDGGADTVWGAKGPDLFYMGASFTAADRIHGGSGMDYVVLDGDYSAGVDLTAKTLTGIEGVTLTEGHSYRLAGLANVAGVLSIVGLTLGAGDQMVIDASGRADALHVLAGDGDDLLTGGDGADVLIAKNGMNTVFGGAGDDVLHGGSGSDLIDGGEGKDRISAGDGDNTVSGGAGNDLIVIGAGVQSVMGGDGSDVIVARGAFDVSDRIDGGESGGAPGRAGDVLRFTGAADGVLVFQADTIRNITMLQVQGDGYDITLDDGNVADGGVMWIRGYSQAYRVDASAEGGGRIIFEGSSEGDTIIGGAGDDQLTGGFGRDRIVGGGGDDFFLNFVDGDTLVGGAGADWFRFSEYVTADASLIQDLQDKDRIDLSGLDADSTQSGYQSFHLVEALSGHAGELALVYDSAEDMTRLEGDTDGDGQGDLVILLAGDHRDFTHFTL